MATNINDTYQVDGSANQVVLHITIGYAQQGASGVILDGTQITTGAGPGGSYSDSFDLVLGTNQQVFGKLLVVNSAVARIQAAEQRTSLQISLTGGVYPKVYPLMSSNAANVGDVIDYLTMINFIH